MSSEKSSLDAVIAAYSKNYDLTLLDENLKLTPQQRIDNLQALHYFDDELKKASKKAGIGPTAYLNKIETP